MAELMPCPCGQTPQRLVVEGVDDGESPKWARVGGLCCGSWDIEFRNDYMRVGSEQSNRRASEAWNAAPRAKAPEPQR